MKILAIGDPHGNLDKLSSIKELKEADLILLTGDIGKADLARKLSFRKIERKEQGLSEIQDTPEERRTAYLEVYHSTISVLKYLSKFAPVYTIFGNVEMHDTEVKKKERGICYKLPRFVRNIQKINGVSIINNTTRNFNGIRIGGLEYFIDTCWIKEFKPSNYKEKMHDAKKETEKARSVLSHFKNLDILVCHQPPYELLDKVTFTGAPKHWLGKHAGSKTILSYIKSYQPSYVFCGHIHEGQGKENIGKTEIYNLGVCGYKLLEL